MSAVKTPSSKATTSPSQHVAHHPADQQQVADLVARCYAANTPVYPVGGGTSLDYGLVAKESGAALHLGALKQVIDYPARDMTITVEAGLTFAELAAILAQERQQLPFDPPQAEQATLGGIVALNHNGPRRFGHGAVRDFVIGITAVNGRGQVFHGGGRVVKNVAGYDFCKLLTGSFGTLGVITQLTFKVRPLPEKSLLVVTDLVNEAAAEAQLSALMVSSAATPVGIELLRGPQWQSRREFRGLPSLGTPAGLALVARLEGTAVEVDWMAAQLEREFRAAGRTRVETLPADDKLWREIVEFSALPDSPLVVKAQTAPSGVTAVLRAARELDPEVSVLAHAGQGTTWIRFPVFPEKGITAAVVGRLQPVAAAYDGSVVVAANPTGAEATRQCVWGAVGPAGEWMTEVKKRFDPRNILNRGRFIYPGL